MDEPTRQLHLALAALPNTLLSYVTAPEGQGEIRAGEELIFRDAGSPLAIAHAAALNSAIAAGRGLAGNPGREAPGKLTTLIADALMVVTRLHPTLSVLPIGLLSKLLVAGLDQQRLFPMAAATVDPDRAAEQRRETVYSFCDFLLSNGDSFDLPSGKALSIYVERWNALSTGVCKEPDGE